MQLKLLNFHRIVSSFATNIVGAFVALIIYQSTNSFVWAFVYLGAMNLLRIIFTKIFFKLIHGKPQLILLLRIVPFLLYSVSILLLDTQLKIVAIFLILFFQACSLAFSDLPMEYVFSYSALGKKTSTTGISRLYSQLGALIAFIMGGLFLDYLSTWIVIIISCVTYLISVIPLFIYYLKEKNSTGFNKEAISNAAEEYGKINIKRHQLNVLQKKILRNYFIVYFSFCIFDSLLSVFSLYIFKVSAESYSFVAYIQVAYNGFYGLGSYLIGKLDEKKDLTALVSGSFILSSIIVCIVPFVVSLIWLEIILFSILGFIYSIISLFCYSRMMSRCQILGVSNLGLFNRFQSSAWAQFSIEMFCAISPVLIVPSFFVMSAVSLFGSIFVPKNEESSRKIIVDFLQNNKMY